jgi:glyoxylase-like metal-dependent hydrolase (beta-lactamase superfamily II)
MLDELRILSAGFCVHPEAMTRRGAAWRGCRFPSGFAVMRHPRHGIALFDTGYTEAFTAETRAFPGLLYGRIAPVHIDDAESARSQLAALGIGAGDVRHVVVSHFHADHMAGLRDFPKALVTCSRAAWNSVRNARGVAAVLKGFLPGLMPRDVERRLRFVEDVPACALPAALTAFGVGRDLFGDGAVLAVDLPGHAAGHIGLLVHSASGAPTFLVGDAAWSREAIATAAPPPAITTALLGNTRVYRATLQRLSALHHASAGLTIVPSHAGQPPQATRG